MQGTQNGGGDGTATVLHSHVQKSVDESKLSVEHAHGSKGGRAVSGQVGGVSPPSDTVADSSVGETHNKTNQGHVQARAKASGRSPRNDEGQQNHSNHLQSHGDDHLFGSTPQRSVFATGLFEGDERLQHPASEPVDLSGVSQEVIIDRLITEVHVCKALCVCVCVYTHCVFLKSEKKKKAGNRKRSKKMTIPSTYYFDS